MLFESFLDKIKNADSFSVLQGVLLLISIVQQILKSCHETREEVARWRVILEVPFYAHRRQTRPGTYTMTVEAGRSSVITPGVVRLLVGFP